MAEETDADGGLRADSENFPSGMAALADYVHDRGLKFGLYSSAGSHTCQGYPASLGRERRHAEQFAEWGVDYLKYDNCGDHRGRDAVDRYRTMGEALAGVDRDIVYSICEWGEHEPWAWARNVGGHLWRTTDDIVAKYRGDPGEFGLGIADIIEQTATLKIAGAHGPGGWNDPDMLQVGNGPESGQSQHEPATVHRPLTGAESRTHFGFWCLLAAPLMVGTDLSSLTEHDRDILTNDRLIAINQDPLGIQGTPDRRDQDVSVWSKCLEDGGAAVALWNRADEWREIHAHTETVDVHSGSGSYDVLDCWTGETWTTSDELTTHVEPRDTAMLRVTPA